MKTIYNHIYTLTFIISLLGLNSIYAQDYIMTNGGSATTCTGTFLDPGGWGNYGSNVPNSNYTICNPIPGQPIYVDFTSFHLWANGCVIPSYDELFIYNGNSTTAPLIGVYNRQNGPTSTIMGTTGCITFRYVRDSGTFLCAANSGAPGWSAIISCTPPSTNDGQTCITANPFCSSNIYNFPNTVNNTAPISGPNYGCLLSQPNPFWYYMEIDQPGSLSLTIKQTTGMGGTGVDLDVDFAMWGPYNDLVAACTDIMAGANPIQCSYHPSFIETLGIGLQGGSNFTSGGQTTPPAAQTGEIYLVMMTNYSGDPGYITFNQTGGTGSAECNIIDNTCNITNVTTDTDCTSPTQYTLSGIVEFNNPPATGTLTVTTSCGGTQTFNAPFTSPISYSITGLNPNGGNCTVSTGFSDGIGCTRSKDFVAPTITTPTFPTFNVCQGSTAPILPTTSNEGIVGTWSPATVNTATTGSTTYTFTPSSVGCHRNTTMNITVNPLPHVGVNPTNYTIGCTAPQTAQLNGISATIGATFNWTGNGFVSGQSTATPIVNATGTYTLTVTNPTTGCTNSTTATVVGSSDMPVVSIDPANDISCTDPTVTLNAISSTPGATFTWATNPGIVSGSTTLTPTVNQAGTYQITVQAPNGCTNAASIIIDGNVNIPTVNNTPTDFSISCLAPSVVISGESTTPNTIYTWIVGGSVSTVTNPEITANSPGTYIVTVTDTTNNCTNSATFNVTGNNVAPTLSVTTPNPITCYEPAVQITATATPSNLVYSWAGPGIVSGEYSPTATVNQDGSYTIAVIDTTSNCYTFTNVTVVSSAPITPTIFGDTTLCGLTFQVPGSSITSNGNIFWTETNGNGSFNNNTGTSPTFTGISGVSNYTLNFTDQCGMSASANLTMIAPAVVSAPVVSCFLGEMNITSTSFSGGTWSIVDNPATPYDEDTTITFVYGEVITGTTGLTGVTTSEPGDVTLIFTPNDNCSSTSVTLSFPPYVWTEINDTTLCMNETYELHASEVTTPVSYLWNDGSTGKSITVTQPGTYIVTINNACHSHSDTAIVNYEVCTIEAPNIISLSSQSGNDKWFVKSTGIEDFKCIIVNRWGNLVFEMNNINQYWNGKDMNGNTVTEGVYFYTIDAKYTGGENVKKHGFIELKY